MKLYQEKTTLRDWLPVCTISFAAFVFITTEIMPIGLLPEISQSLGKSESFTGLIVTAYAWCVALTSLPLVMLTKALDRKKILMTVFLIFILCHILASQAMNFEILLLARIGIALSHAIFWSLATPLAARLAPAGRQAKALAIVVTGGSLATVLGMPLGTLVGHHFGWRVSFIAVALLAFFLLLIMSKTLPSLPSKNESSLESLASLLKQKSIIIIYIVTMFFVTGHFVSFSYLVPFLHQTAGIEGDGVVFLLLLLGVAGILGSGIASKFAENKPFKTLFTCLMLVIIALSSLSLLAPYKLALGVACLMWGAGMVGVGLVLQVLILNLAKNTADMGIAIYSSIFNVGIGGGAFIGSLVLYYLDTSYIGLFGAVFIFLALISGFFLWQERKKDAAKS